MQILIASQGICCRWVPRYTLTKMLGISLVTTENYYGVGSTKEMLLLTRVRQICC